jgi:outer membrane beta-barrel protein
MMKKWIIAAIATAVCFSAQAQPAEKDDRGSDKLDLKKLEDKYWAAKDTDFTVVQNRAYTKAKRGFVSLSYGPLVNDAYSYGRMTNIAAGYYFSERWGVEVAYENGSIRDNDSTDIFKNVNQFPPDYNKFKSYKSINMIVVPFYAKMSFWDRKVMYFDLQFAAGIGQMDYQIQKINGNPTVNPSDASENKTAMGYNLDITQQLFFHEHFALRFDIKNKWSKQNKERYFLSGSQERSLGNINQQDTTMLLGLTIFY